MTGHPGTHEEFRDRRGILAEGSFRWALRVVLRDGSAIVAEGTQWSPAALAAIEGAAERHGIAARLAAERGRPDPGHRLFG